MYVPDAVTISTRPMRVYNVYNSYNTRPWVTYHDPYNSFFWWWLLDRSLDDRAYWAYHHRASMDAAPVARLRGAAPACRTAPQPAALVAPQAVPRGQSRSNRRFLLDDHVHVGAGPNGTTVRIELTHEPQIGA